jgi:hypothetical protein
VTGFDTAAELRPRMGARAGVWEFLHRFNAAWGLPPTAADRRGDMTTPPALREAYACCGVLDQGDLETESGVMIFHRSGRAIAETRWGIPLDSIDRADPPTLVNTGSGWEPYLDRLSLTCVDLAMTAVIEQARCQNGAELPPTYAPAVAVAFDRVPLPALPMWIDVESSPARWYSGPGQLLRTHGDDWMWLWVKGQDRAALDAIYAALPDADWAQGM